MSIISKIIGDKIRNMRKQQDWSQEELAHRAGIHPSHMGQIERGEKSPTVDSIEKIVVALGITFEELFESTGQIEKNRASSVLVEIVKRLNKCTEKEQKIILNVIDSLFEWKELKWFALYIENNLHT